MQTVLDTIMEELEQPASPLICAGKETTSICFTLHHVKCHKTEDFLDGDECRLTVSVDGIHKKTLKRQMKGGQLWQLGRDFPFGEKIVVSLWDEDWPDPDDLIGRLKLDKISMAGTATKSLKRSGAHYSIKYSVKHPRTPQTPPSPTVDRNRCMRDRPTWVQWDPSPNHKNRGGKTIDRIIYHATGGKELRHAINGFKSTKQGTSAHYVISRDGQVIQMVELSRAAQHAGSYYNARSIGIETVNARPLYNKGKKVEMCDVQKKEGHRWVCTEWTSVQPIHAREDYYRHSPYWDRNEWWIPYTEAQYRSLIKLTRFLISCIPTIKYITGHEHLLSWKNGKYKNRNDPGGAFDWSRIEQALKGRFGGYLCHHYSRKTPSGSVDPRWRDSCPGFRP